MRLRQKPIMKKRFLVALAILAASISFAQQKKEPPPPPAPPPPPKINNAQVRFPPPVVYPDPLPDDYKDFLKRNPTVKGIGWMKGNKVHILLKSGKDEVYNLNNENDVQKLEDKYGELPMSPPPPPSPPKAAKTISES